MARPFRLELLPLRGGPESLGERRSDFVGEGGFVLVKLAQCMGVARGLSRRLRREQALSCAEMVRVSLDHGGDEVLAVRKAQASHITTGSGLLCHIEALSPMPKRDQEALLLTIDAFLALHAGKSGDGRAA